MGMTANTSDDKLPGPVRLFARAARLIRTLALSIVLPACVSLPDISYLNTRLDAKATPTIATGQGHLSKNKAELLLARRLRNSATSIKALAALEEAATGSPLIAGNKVTLLFDGPQTI